MAFTRFFLLALFVLFASAHVCLISPPQRGSLTGLNTPASADCFLTTGPCGGRPAQEADVLLVRGTNFTITWQKNENHWTAANPGSFNLSFADIETPTKFVPIYSFVDNPNTPALTLYSYILEVDKIQSKAGILQIQYVAPAIPLTFYQCADLMIV